mgnify:CR=1 FL=1
MQLSILKKIISLNLFTNLFYKMSLKQKAVKGVIWSAMENWGRQAISFGVFFLLARLLGPETFGLVALASVFLAFIQVFLDQGLSQAIVQRHELEEEHLDTAFWTNIGISLLLTTVSIACAGLVADFYKEPQLTAIIRCLSLTFVFGSVSGVQGAMLSRQLAFKALAIRSLIAMLIGGIVGVTMAFMGFGVWSLVGQQLANSLAQALVLWWVSDWRPGFKVSKKHFKELFSFGINVLGIRILDFFNRRSDDFLIGYFLGPVALGYYSIAYRLLLTMTQLLTSITTKVAMPTFSRLQQDLPRLRRGFYTAIQFTSLVSFPAFLGMSVLAPELVRALFGEKWLPSIPVMQILAFIGILHSVYYFNATIIMAMGKPSWKLGLNCLNAITNVIGFYIAVRWGIVAVAASYVIRGYVLSPLPLLVIRKLINIDLKTYFSQFIPPVIGSMGMVATILITKYLLHERLNLYALLTLCVAISIVVYTMILALIAPKLSQQVIGLAQSVVPLGKTKKL